MAPGGRHSGEKSMPASRVIALARTVAAVAAQSGKDDSGGGLWSDVWQAVEGCHEPSSSVMPVAAHGTSSQKAGADPKQGEAMPDNFGDTVERSSKRPRRGLVGDMCADMKPIGRPVSLKPLEVVDTAARQESSSRCRNVNAATRVTPPRESRKEAQKQNHPLPQSLVNRDKRVKPQPPQQQQKEQQNVDKDFEQAHEHARLQHDLDMIAEVARDLHILVTEGNEKLPGRKNDVLVHHPDSSALVHEPRSEVSKKNMSFGDSSVTLLILAVTLPLLCLASGGLSEQRDVSVSHNSAIDTSTVLTPQQRSDAEKDATDAAAAAESLDMAAPASRVDEASGVARREAPSSSTVTDEPTASSATEELSVLAITALTSYKFYIGFLNTTWVPFLVAREGEALMGSHQSMFMGIEKLIYGASMMCNPILGLLSDKMSESSPKLGRLLFVIAGITMESAAICICRHATQAHEVAIYFVASIVWMFGEALVDVVTEALPPLMLLEKQYDMASAIRSLHFLLGGLAGYLALLFLHETDYMWMYAAYMVLMLVCILPSLTFIRVIRASPVDRTSASDERFLQLSSFYNAFIAPARMAGCFPRACFCMFLFSLGTGPNFFTLLFVRDLVGISSHANQQFHFAGISIVFLLSAAVSSGLSGTSSHADGGSEQRDGRAGSDPPGQPPVQREVVSTDEGGDTGGTIVIDDRGQAAPTSCSTLRSSIGVRSEPSVEARGWGVILASVFGYGLTIFVSPFVCLLGSQAHRLIGMYVISFPFGILFGSVFSRFKARTWSLLPPEADVANAMAFASVMQVAGCGIGNFACGLVLEAFSVPGGNHKYDVRGYIAMAWLSALPIFLCVMYLRSIIHDLGLEVPSFRRLLLPF
eukprot:TRINITY_DN21506_c0_g1_i1.p1 TRINITY_DN21506_c0_g1~~TRINITY_DN21506_c0_g1_i1.p1  ORF type:complete len:873 (+),score=137.84 TRINITY_DN21506_c0_g1_i1:21-2639(+)